VAFAVVSYADWLSYCFSCDCGILSLPKLLCACAPNTFVTVLVNGNAVGHTTTVRNNLHPTWPPPPAETPIEIDITSPEDVITFVVASEGLSVTLIKNPVIFRCDADIAGLAIGTLACTSPWSSISAPDPTKPANLPPTDLLYRVAAGVTKKILQ
jgi:hypothetical protein